LSGIASLLPEDWHAGSFLVRFRGEDGPGVALIRAERWHDITDRCPTVSSWRTDLAVQGTGIAVDEAIDDSDLLSPIDLHCVKAAGVTFAVSAIERVIEERARGLLNGRDLGADTPRTQLKPAYIGD